MSLWEFTVLTLLKGLDEYMQWCEDMDMTPILAVWSGHDLSGGSITGDSLDPYVDDILNELEVSINYSIRCPRC